MDSLSWGGFLGPYLGPVMLAAACVFAAAWLAAVSGLTAGRGGARNGTVAIPTPGRYALAVLLGCLLLLLSSGVFFRDPRDQGIIGALSLRMAPVWLSLLATFLLSFRFRRRLGLYGRIFDSGIGMFGLALVLFWVFTAFYAGVFDLVATHDPLAQSALMKRAPPGTAYGKLFGAPDPQAGAHYLLGGDSLGRDVFSRVIAGSVKVILIAPFATAFAFAVGIVLGLAAAYYGGALDGVLTFVANMVLAFPVILLFYLLVTPEITMTALPTVLAGVLFVFPVLLAVLLATSRFRADPRRRALWVALALLLGGWLFVALALQADPLGLIAVPSNLLIVFVSVVFVNSPNIFRIVRGLALDVKTRDYVAAAQTRGEGAWYIMLWEILPNTRGPLLVDFCLRIGYVTILLGTLGFFGLGLDSESPDWGKMIIDGRHLLAARILHISISPAIPLLTLVLGLNLLADALREQSLRD